MIQYSRPRRACAAKLCGLAFLGRNSEASIPKMSGLVRNNDLFSKALLFPPCFRAPWKFPRRPAAAAAAAAAAAFTPNIRKNGAISFPSLGGVKNTSEMTFFVEHKGITRNRKNTFITSDLGYSLQGGAVGGGCSGLV